MRSNGWFRYVALAALVAFVWPIVVSVSPRLHQRIHADQGRSDHQCAVTFVRSGSYHDAAAPTPTGVVKLAVALAHLPELTSQWIASPFQGAAIFEHAPPTRS